MIEDHYNDSVTYLDRVPKADPEALFKPYLNSGQRRGFRWRPLSDSTIIEKLIREGFLRDFIKNRNEPLAFASSERIAENAAFPARGNL